MRGGMGNEEKGVTWLGRGQGERNVNCTIFGSGENRAPLCDSGFLVIPQVTGIRYFGPESERSGRGTDRKV
jgi:hypothetical protein